MGKGQIISEYGQGYYQVKIIYGYRDIVDARIANMQNQITILNSKIAEMDEGLEKDVMILQVTSLEKQIAWIQDNMPDDVIRNIFCSDFTEGLTGDVGLIEIPAEVFEKISYPTISFGDRITSQKYAKINIQPGHSGNAVYSEVRDKELVPIVAQSTAQGFYNKAALPAVQKWKPRHRYGVIVADSINFAENTVSVCLDPEYSSQLNLKINQGETFSECDGMVPDGFNDFCVANPTHPTCTNTEPGGGYFVSASMFETIKSINSQVNSEHEYETDKSGYGIGEFWTEMGPGESGDCEDFALTKQKALYDAGIPIQHLQLAYGETEVGGWHAFLVIRSSNRGVMVLDNRYENVMDISKVPYRFAGYQKAGLDWRNYGTRIDNVPVEYMSCNAGAFADGDQVVVEFTDRDWTKPKVIGFRSYPQGCLSAGIYFWTCWQSYAPLYGKLYGQIINFSSGYGSYTSGHDWAHQLIDGSCATYNSGADVLFIGGYWQYPSTTVDTVYGYNVNSDTWADKMSINDHRMYLAAGGIAGSILIQGGYTYPVQGLLETTEKYDYSTDSWSYKQDESTRALHCSFVLSNKFYVIGGVQTIPGWGGITAEGKKYSESGDAWSSIADFPTGLAFNVSFEDFATGKGYVGIGLVFGQWDNSEIADDAGIYYTRRFYEYNPVADTWTQVADYDTWGCKAFWYDGDPEFPAGWYVDPEDCEDKDWTGHANACGIGGYDIGWVPTMGNFESPFYHQFQPEKYTPSLDTWQRYGWIGLASPWPTTCAGGSCACSI